MPCHIFTISFASFFACAGHTSSVAKRSVKEMENTAFWCGIGTGMVLGAAVGMALAPKPKSMKTCVGRTMQQMGNAMDSALGDMMRAAK